MKKYSVMESAAIVAAQTSAMLDEGREDLPVPAWSKILFLAVDNLYCEGENSPCNYCSYNCRCGEATILVAFRNGIRYEVSLRGREIDPRLGVSMETPTRVVRVR